MRFKGDRDDAPIWVYSNGPALERSCPNCGRFLKMPSDYTWWENWQGICKFEKIECSKCGPVEPNHVGWDGDYD